MSVMQKIARASVTGQGVELTKDEVHEVLDRFSRLEAECAMHVKSREEDQKCIRRAAQSVRELLRDE